MTASASTLTELQGAVAAAHQRLEGLVIRTPVRKSNALSHVFGVEVYLKMEHLQVTGSFKVRGALNKLLTDGVNAPHVVAASTGNHAQAVAYACAQLGKTCTLFLPTSASKQKVAALRQYDVELRFVEGDAIESELKARRDAAREEHLFVSPYNDLAVVAGQGTLGAELVTQVEAPDFILVAVGGGGMISGIAAACRARGNGARIVGCSPEASPVMHKSVQAGRVLDFPSQATLSDGTAGGLESATITYGLCEALVDEWLLVSEDQIAEAMRLLYEQESLIVEGAAGVALGVLLAHGSRFSGQRVGVVLCGRNVDWTTFQTVTQ